MKSFLFPALRLFFIVMIPFNLFAQLIPVKQESQQVKTLQPKATEIQPTGKTFQGTAKPLTPTPEQVSSYNWYRRINPNNVLSVINPANAQQLSDASIQSYLGRAEMNLTGWINQKLDLGIAASCDSLVHIRVLTNLEYVRLRSYPSDACIANLAGLRKIKYLQYAGASSMPENLNITDASMRIIGNFTNLEFLDIFSCGNVTDNGLASLSGLVNMKELNLNYWTGLSSSCLQYLVNMKKLQKLRLVGVNLKDDSFLSLAGLTELNFLNCTRATGLTDKTADHLIVMLAQMPRLTQINLQFTGVSDQAKQRIRAAYPGVSIY